MKELFDEEEDIIDMRAYISGGYDKNGMVTDINPSTIAYGENGNWYDYETIGEDDFHIFRLRNSELNAFYIPDYGVVGRDGNCSQTLNLQIGDEVELEEWEFTTYVEMEESGTGIWEINPSLDSLSGEKEISQEDKNTSDDGKEYYELCDYIVSNINASKTDRLNIESIISMDSLLTRDTVTAETYFLGGASGGATHLPNHPDDAQLIAEANYPTDRIYNPWSNIGVLLSGAGVGISHIMGKFNTGICGVIPENFKISGISGRQLEDLDVLIIGSAGIYVINNPQLRERLRKWVEYGGTVISMTSQFGFEWEYLPIPDGEQLQGYGWDEDQYCTNSSVYIEDRHPIISGQTKSI